MTARAAAGAGEASRARWVLLSYHLPREPSTPRIAVWRALKRLGVAQLGDGLVTLPLDARTREQLEWIADDIRKAGGEASLWIAEAATFAQEQAVAQDMASARAAEYRAVIDEARRLAAQPQALRAVQRLRRELRRINRRDYFPQPEREVACIAVNRLAALHPATTQGSS